LKSGFGGVTGSRGEVFAALHVVLDSTFRTTVVHFPASNTLAVKVARAEEEDMAAVFGHLSLRTFCM